MKTCNRCKVEKSETEFYKNCATPHGLTYACKPCCAELRRENRHRHANDPVHKKSRAEWKKDYLRRNPDRAAVYRLRARLKLYGLTEAQYTTFRLDQKNLCACCQRPLDDKWVVEHSHKSGKVRGLVCVKCNNGIGMFEDNPALLRLAIQYLEKHQDE